MDHLPTARPATAAPTRHTEHLEPAQLDAHARRPVPPAALTARTRAGLWALRVFVLIVSAMVIYTFIAQL